MTLLQQEFGDGGICAVSRRRDPEERSQAGLHRTTGFSVGVTRVCCEKGRQKFQCIGGYGLIICLMLASIPFLGSQATHRSLVSRAAVSSTLQSANWLSCFSEQQPGTPMHLEDWTPSCPPSSTCWTSISSADVVGVTLQVMSRGDQNSGQVELEIRRGAKTRQLTQPCQSARLSLLCFFPELDCDQ